MSTRGLKPETIPESCNLSVMAALSSGVMCCSHSAWSMVPSLLASILLRMSSALRSALTPRACQKKRLLSGSLYTV